MCAAFSNATPPTIRTALTISRPQNCERKAPESVGTLSLPVGTHGGTASRENGVDFCLGQADIHRVTGASRVKFLAWGRGETKYPVVPFKPSASKERRLRVEPCSVWPRCGKFKPAFLGEGDVLREVRNAQIFDLRIL